MIRFKYLNPRIRLTPRDLNGTAFDRPRTLHFICSPTRALTIVSEVREVEGWSPLIIYEPIPVMVFKGNRLYKELTQVSLGQVRATGTTFPD